MKQNQEKDAQIENLKDQKASDEFVDIEENKKGLKRQIAEAKFFGKHWLNIFKTQTLSTVIGGLIFIACLYLSPYYIGEYFEVKFRLGGLGVIVGFGVAILGGILVSVVYRKVAMHIARNDKKAVKEKGIVVASSYLASHIVGMGSGGQEARKVLGVVYKVKIKVNNKKSITYSYNRCYESGEKVTVLFNKKRPWHSYIVQDD